MPQSFTSTPEERIAELQAAQNKARKQLAKLAGALEFYTEKYCNLMDVFRKIQQEIHKREDFFEETHTEPREEQKQELTHLKAMRTEALEMIKPKEYEEKHAATQKNIEEMQKLIYQLDQEIQHQKAQIENPNRPASQI